MNLYNIKKMDKIEEIFNNLINIILKYVKFIIFVVCVTFIIPITFYIWLLSMGFLSSGITDGSSAASWMSSLCNVPSRSIFSKIQSISTWGYIFISSSIYINYRIYIFFMY